jgi:hypothetical protein
VLTADVPLRRRDRVGGTLAAQRREQADGILHARANSAHGARRSIRQINARRDDRHGTSACDTSRIKVAANMATRDALRRALPRIAPCRGSDAVDMLSSH